jgi:hypothetical protein
MLYQIGSIRQTQVSYKRTTGVNYHEHAFPPTPTARAEFRLRCTVVRQNDVLPLLGKTLADLRMFIAPMTEAEKHMFSVDRMIENNADRWFYATKPVTAQNLITYHVNVPISGHVCAAKLTVKIGHSEAELRMIAATVSAAK